MAQLAHFYFTHDSGYQVVAFCLDRQFIDVPDYLGLPMVAFQDLPSVYPAASHDAFVAIGYSQMNGIRKEKFEAVRARGYKMATYLSSRSSSWRDTRLGENVFIMENNTIMPFCTIEDNVTVWVGSILSHHSVIKKHTTITSHVTLGGDITVGQSCFLGLNSTICNGITLEEQTVVAAGATLMHSSTSGGVYHGNPAQRVGHWQDIDL
jgi:sugar O-acyltransferase (sialic acid O-acetyltransferase NeuD family)